MNAKIKWLATRGTYQIDRVEETPVQVPYIGTDNKPHGTVAGVRITGYAGDVAVIRVTLAGNHPRTTANYREAMARQIQNLGGSWKGRSAASETAKADARVNRLDIPQPGETAEERKARIEAKNSYYAGVPYPSDY